MRAGEGFTLFISNEDMNDISKSIKSLEGSNVLIDGITETVRHEIKKQGRYLPSSLMQPVISSVVNGISGTGVRRAGKGYIEKNFKFRSIHEIIPRLLIVPIANLDLMTFFREIIYLEQKMEYMG